MAAPSQLSSRPYHGLVGRIRSLGGPMLLRQRYSFSSLFLALQGTLLNPGMSDHVQSSDMVLMGYAGALGICHYSHGTVRCLVQYIVFNVIHGVLQNSSVQTLRGGGLEANSMAA